MTKSSSIKGISVDSSEEIEKLKEKDLQKKNKSLKKKLNKLKDQNTKLQNSLAKKTQIHQKLRKELSNEISDHIKSIVELKRSNYLLTNINKELNCLTSISKLDTDNLPLETFLKQVIEIIPTAFQYPKYAFCQLSYNGELYQSTKCKPTKYVLSEEVNYNKDSFGSISVFYKSELLDVHNGYFLQEESQLIKTIANILGRKIHRVITDEQLNIFRRAIDQSPLMISIFNFKTKKTEYINLKFSSVLGYGLEEMKSRNPFTDTNNPKLVSVIKQMKASINNGETWNGTYQTNTIDGKHFWQRSSLYPLIDKGEITHILSIGEDISKEIEIEEELRINKENYEHVSENSPGGIFIVNSEGKFLYANKKASEITGYSNSELLKASVNDLLHPDHLEEIYKNLKSRLEGHETKNNYEAKVISKTGEIIIVEVAGTKSMWKGEAVDLIAVNDITTKSRFSNLLKIQNEIDYMRTISVGQDQSFKQIFETLFRFDWIDSGGIYLMNKEKSELNLVFSKGISSKFIAETQQYLKGSAQFDLVEQQTTIYLKSFESPIMAQEVMDEGLKSLIVIPLIHEGNVIGSLNLASKVRGDLSENEKMVFEAIGNRIAQMIALIETQEKLQVNNRKLKETLEQIQEKQQLLIQKSKLESLGEMAAGVAHEINQPLGIISLSLENILFKVSSKTASEDYLNQKFNSIFDNINKIDEIINHIRTFSRDQKSIIIERVDLNEIIMEAFSLIKEQYSFYNIEVDLNLDEKIDFTIGNKHKLEQVTYNLLSNAKYALDEKETSQHDVIFEKKITIKTYNEEKFVHLDIRDNGCGIEPDKLENVFNPFFTTKPEGHGTGLGLSIVYGIISEMKGTIDIESIQNEYTTVKIKLPKHKT